MIQDTDVTTIVHTILTAEDATGTGRTTYLRALVQATKDELTKKGEPASAQLKALNAVHKRFYAIVLAAAQPFVPKSTKGRAVELHRRVNFARTSLSAVRGHIRSGADVYALNSNKVTKGALLQPPQKKTNLVSSTKRLKLKAQSQTKSLMATLVALAAKDKASAGDEIQITLAELSAQLISMGYVVTTNANVAFKEHRPLKKGAAMFLPVNPALHMDGGFVRANA